MGTRSASTESMDIHGLSDDDLYHKILSYGVNIGPVVASTRFLYEKKLYDLILSVKATAHNGPEVTPRLPPVASEPEVPIIIQRAKESNPMRTEVAAGGPIPNTAFSAGATPDAFESVNESQRPKIKETKEIISEPIAFEGLQLTPSVSRWTKDGSGLVAEEEFRTPSSEIRARRALYSKSPSLPPHIQFSGYGNGIGSEAKSSTAKIGKQSQTQPAKKIPKSKLTVAIEVAVIAFLLGVGFLFYQEMRTLDEAVENDHVEL